MPLDPQAQAVLDNFASLNLPPLWTLPPEQVRQITAAMRPPIEGEAVARIDDRTVPGPGGEIPIRVYTPEGARPLPGLVYFHGGGWVIGSIEGHDITCRALTNASGCVVVSVEYRLAPEHPFPASVEDAYAATRWVSEHAAELGIDPTRLAVGGDSAGGNLAAVVAQLAREAGGPPLAFQLLVYPVTGNSFDTASYRDNADGYFLTRDWMRWFWQYYLPDESARADPRAAPLMAEDLSGLPPALVITAEFDPLRDEGEAYARALREAGVDVTVTRYDGMIHGFFTMSTALTRGREALEQAGTALRRQLAAQPVG